MFRRVKNALGQSKHKLSEEQKEHFLKYGYVRVPQCFSREKASEWTGDVWTRLGFSATDRDTWTSEITYMPAHRHEHVKSFAPKAWAAICELVGGEDRVLGDAAVWNDAFIANLGRKDNNMEGEQRNWPNPKDLHGWHVDGDFFIHFLDSGEQGLLVIPVFSDIVDHAGGTVVCPDSIPFIARHLYNNPQGVTPQMVPRGQQPDANASSFYRDIINQCSEFHEMTGQVGDVILLHPLMVHSVSVNSLRNPRFITNPPVMLREAFRFNRKHADDFSLVERKTLRSLGVERLDDWAIVGGREMVVPERLRVQAEMKEQERGRMAA